jgi:hypothetical protein
MDTPMVEVRRNEDTMFYLKNLKADAWQVTPKGANNTIEYK